MEIYHPIIPSLVFVYPSACTPFQFYFKVSFILSLQLKHMNFEYILYNATMLKNDG
jgi:hypothetical protein